MKFDDRVWKHWAEDWLPAIKKDLRNTIRDHAVFREFLVVVEENAEWLDSFEGGFFCHFVARGHLAQVALGIRRHVKSKGGAISLMRLREQISKCSNQITYDHYLLFHPVQPNEPPWQRITFDSRAKNGVLNRDLVAADMLKLRELSAAIEAFADKNIAHMDSNGYNENIAWKDIDAALEQFNRTACRYITLLSGDGYETLEPTILVNWKRVFDNPMRKPDGAALPDEDSSD